MNLPKPITLSGLAETRYSVRITPPNACYVLLDFGDGRKLERFGDLVLDRPEPQAMGPRALPLAKWDAADAVFMGADAEDDSEGRWKFRGSAREKWDAQYRNVTFYARATAFRHAGFFPEQASHWDWMLEKLQAFKKPRVLNLFAYTGVASLLAAKAGAAVTHLDASKKAIGWAKENAERAGLQAAPIRWIVEDARSFVAREERREKSYDLILLDPPKFGRGTEGEVWDLFLDLPDLLRSCRAVLNPSGGVVMLTVYAVRASFIAFDELCRAVFPEATIISGELAVQAEGAGGRLLPTSHFCFIEMPR